jgi:hypothetical protein
MMMSKTSDTSKFDHAKLENRVLADSELDAVSGGWSLSGIPGAMAHADFTFAVDASTKVTATGAMHKTEAS